MEKESRNHNQFLNLLGTANLLTRAFLKASSLRYNSESIKFARVRVQVKAFNIFTNFCNHHDLRLQHFINPQRNPEPISGHHPILPINMILNFITQL